MMYCFKLPSKYLQFVFSKYEKMNWYNGFMEGFSCISNTVTYLSTPIEDSTLLKSKFMAFYLINMKSQYNYFPI